MQVWSRGAETSSELSFKANKILFKINLLTNYVLSTNQKSKSIGDASVGKLLIYTPMYSGHLKISAQYKKFIFSYKHSYTGYRYTSTDNTEFLTPYNLASVYAAYQLSLKKYDINLFVEANNIFNQQYQILLNRAMPLVNFQAGFSIQFHQNEQSK